MRWGAEVVLVEQAPGGKPGEVSGEDLEKVDDEAARLTKKLGAYRADQFGHPGNRNAHYYGTATEIWQQSGQSINAFCDFAGSGGSFAGCTRYFREQDAGIQCFVVEPAEAAALSGGKVTNPGHPIQGGG